MARRSKPPIQTLIDTIGPPISSQPWSPSFTAQTLEVLPVGMSDGALFWMKPMHADSLRVGLPPSATPADVVLDVLKWYPLAAIVVHSTSWRHEEGRIILTYIAVVARPSALPPDSLTITPVSRAQIARGEAMAAPKSIGVDAVLEHALRHLSWLVRDDPSVMQALSEWKHVLADYQPEPFRSLA